MARDLNITMTLYPGKDISFSVPEAQAKSYFDNGDIAKPIRKKAERRVRQQVLPRPGQGNDQGGYRASYAYDFAETKATVTSYASTNRCVS